MELTHTAYLKKILKEYDVEAHTDTKVVEILDNGVLVENNQVQIYKYQQRP